MAQGFPPFRIGVKPEDFLQVLQKVQLDSTHKRAIVEVPPPPSSLSPLVARCLGTGCRCLSATPLHASPGLTAPDLSLADLDQL